MDFDKSSNGSKLKICKGRKLEIENKIYLIINKKRLMDSEKELKSIIIIIIMIGEIDLKELFN